MVIFESSIHVNKQNFRTTKLVTGDDSNKLN